MPELNDEVGVVLSGGGARGAYEAGVLEVLLPELDRRGERPGIVLGTSIGSLNGTHLAATAHLPVARSVARLLELWRAVQLGDIVGPLTSRRELAGLGLYLGGLLGIPGARTPALLDTSPMPGLLRRLVDFAQLHRNADAGLVSLAVVASSYATGGSVVFHEGPAAPGSQTDPKRAIRYVPARIAETHVQASASIPVAFPATRVEAPREAAGWYGDGGTRLNTPIKPALALGARRVLVIGLNSTAPPRYPERHRPDIFDGAGAVVQALLADPVAHDVATLARRNRDEREPVPYIFVSPADRLTLGRLAANTFRSHFAGIGGLLRARDLAVLGHAIGAGTDAARGELFSFLFFATQFHDALIELGRHDARRWLGLRHDDGPWRLGPTPATGSVARPRRSPASPASLTTATHRRAT